MFLLDHSSQLHLVPRFHRICAVMRGVERLWTSRVTKRFTRQRDETKEKGPEAKEKRKTFFVRRRRVLVDRALLGFARDGEIVRELTPVALCALARFEVRAHHRLGVDACTQSNHNTTCIRSHYT